MNEKDFFVEDYKLKIDHVKTHTARMWTRFNFFLTVQLSIFGALGYLLFRKDWPNIEGTGIPISLGIFTSILWYIVGAQDRYLLEGCREDVEDAACRIAKNVIDSQEWNSRFYVGWRKGQAEAKKVFFFKGFYSWYCRYISITRLISVIPVLLLALWIASFFYFMTKQMLWFGC